MAFTFINLPVDCDNYLKDSVEYQVVHWKVMFDYGHQYKPAHITSWRFTLKQYMYPCLGEN